MSNTSWLLCDVRWTWLNNQMAKPDIWGHWAIGRRNNYIKYRTTAIGQLRFQQPGGVKCEGVQGCARPAFLVALPPSNC